MSEERTELSSLGEFGLIEHLTKNNETRQAGTLLGVGDDGAVVDTFGKPVIISTDMLVEGIHFDLMYTGLKHLGYKSVVVNLSDICAMNAHPTHITMSLAISNRYSLEALEEFYEGVYLACARYGVDLIGGDTTSSTKGLVISVTVLGDNITEKIVKRSTARKNDLICVTGDLGAAYLGLQLLEREKKLFLENPKIQPNLEDRAHTIGRFLKPEARTDIIDWLQEQEILPTAMIDVSDGLSSELLHISTQSQLGCVLHEEKIPIHQESREVAFDFKIDPTMCALSGGEDYELLFTVAQEAFEKIRFSEQISVIGYMTDATEGKQLITKNGNTHELIAQGWKSF